MIDVGGIWGGGGGRGGGGGGGGAAGVNIFSFPEHNSEAA